MNPCSASAMLIVQYTTYEYTVESSNIAEFMKNAHTYKWNNIYGSIQTPKILRATTHVQTMYTRPFVLLVGPGDETSYKTELDSYIIDTED